MTHTILDKLQECREENRQLKKAYRKACMILGEKDIKPIPFVVPDTRKINENADWYEEYFLEEARKEGF